MLFFWLLMAVHTHFVSLQYDKHWQGPPPERDVFIIGLNDLAQSDSLKDVCAQFGSVHSLRMHRHPKTKAFLGAATVLYSQAGSARKAVQEIDGKIIAGCYLKADLDDKGEYMAILVYIYICVPLFLLVIMYTTLCVSQFKLYMYACICTPLVIYIYEYAPVSISDNR